MTVIGKNILDSLTTGMYSNSLVIYREYIQNAADQIDKAVKEGLLTQEEAEIEITLDTDKRYISISDNATGIKEKEFISNLGEIANSNKTIGEDNKLQSDKRGEK